MFRCATGTTTFETMSHSIQHKLEWWGHVKSPFGIFTVQGTRLGICAIDFGEGSLDLPKELYQAQKARDLWTPLFTCPSAWASISLDLEGTPFQIQVWNALRELRWGEKVTYGQFAARMGIPSAVRSVASAIAKNKIALFIPCHRVVPAMGGVGQYRWGSPQKAFLLDWEQNNPYI